MNFGKIIQSERYKKNISLDKLSELSDISASTINSWENYGVIPAADKLDRVLCALGIAVYLGDYHSSYILKGVLN